MEGNNLNVLDESRTVDFKFQSVILADSICNNTKPFSRDFEFSLGKILQV